VENSKEGFRQFLLNYFDDADILLNKTRMSERSALAKDNALPLQAMHDISNTYIGIAEKIIGHPLNVSQQPKQEIIDVLDQDYGLIR
jgi:phosphoribosylaminoimidazole-succinocarboxamide synthase